MFSHAILLTHFSDNLLAEAVYPTFGRLETITFNCELAESKNQYALYVLQNHVAAGDYEHYGKDQA